MDNKKLWDELKDVPAFAQKKITGGRLSGMTDIKPQWRYQRLTEVLGPCGSGWRFEVVEKWIDQGSDGQSVANVLVNFYFAREDGTWSAPIPGMGGSMFIAKEKSGMHTSDEAYKMALTDAIGTAAKMIGLAAEVYLGNAAGSSKYSGEQQKKAPPPPPDSGKITEAQLKKLNAMLSEHEMDRVQVKLMLKVASLKDLAKDRASKIFDGWDKFVDLYNARQSEEPPL